MSPRRRVLTPILVYCEGLHDHFFVKHLLATYRNPDSLYYFNVKHGDGGSPKTLVEKAIKLPGDYNQKFVVFDNDREAKEIVTARILGKKNSIQVFCFTPSLEAILLNILEPTKDYTNTSTHICKRRFHSTHMKERDRSDNSKYLETFPKEKLNLARTSMRDLNAIISILEK